MKRLALALLLIVFWATPALAEVHWLGLSVCTTAAEECPGHNYLFEGLQEAKRRAEEALPFASPGTQAQVHVRIVGEGSNYDYNLVKSQDGTWTQTAVNGPCEDLTDHRGQVIMW